MIRRCLEPEPLDRYQRASLLAADLQAVADDMALPHTHEPWPGRTLAWIRRRRGRIAVAAAVLVVFSALLAGGLGLRVERTHLLRQASLEFDMGQEALERGDFSAAMARISAADNLATQSALTPWSYLARFNGFGHIGGQLRLKLEDFKSVDSPENFHALCREKFKLAERTKQVQEDADLLFRAGDALRFRLLLDEGSELDQATQDLQAVMAPFFVLENPDWTKIIHTLPLLDADRRGRLVNDVNELLFLWMAAIDESAALSPQLGEPASVKESGEPLAPALSLCEKARVWVEPKAPWLALEARLRRPLWRAAPRCFPNPAPSRSLSRMSPAR